MAILNGLYIHVINESVEREVEATSHPVEEGVPTSDTVKYKGLTLSLSGKLVDYGDMKAAQVLAKIRELMVSGSLVMYHGRNIESSMQIRSFDTDHPNTNHGGADFTMTLVKVRVAKSAYVPKAVTETTTTTTTTTTPTTSAANKTTSTATAAKKTLSASDIKVGMKVIFKGGNVYDSADAEKAAATRSRSTCKVTIINTGSWTKHSYHLISEDGGKVYGWVDLANIESTETTSTSATTNAGSQQTKDDKQNTTSSSSDGSKTYPVYHKVKSGDTVYSLCQQYSYLGNSVSWVISNNSSAFSTPGNASTLKVGAYLLMGYKQ